MTGKLDSCLTTELYNNTVRLFSFNNGFNVLFCKRIKIQSVTCIEVSGNCFRIVVADYRFIPLFFQGPYAMNGTVIKFDTLTDSDRTRTENNNLFLTCISSFNELLCFIFFIKGRIEVRCFSLKFACACVNHFINGSLS